MFRKKKVPQKKTLDIYWRADDPTTKIDETWLRIISELRNEYVEVVDGPRFYSICSKMYDPQLENGYFGFKRYIIQMGGASIYVPDNF